MTTPTHPLVKARLVVEGLSRNLETAADLIDTMACTLLDMLDADARSRLSPEMASKFESAVQHAGAQAGRFREVVLLSRESFLIRPDAPSQGSVH